MPEVKILAEIPIKLRSKDIAEKGKNGQAIRAA
jgi:hypothetical protein